MGQRHILHCDCNCFYASVEMQEHPELRGKSIAVCGDPEARHGIVLTASYPAKRMGVKTGMPIWEAKQHCRDLIIVPASYGKMCIRDRILTVYGRFFRLYMYTALAPLPLASFAGESTQSVGISFIKSYVGVCLEGAVIVLACVIYAAFVSTPTVSGGEATTMVWSYLTEIIFNMLVLVGLIKGSDRIIHEMMGL